MCEKDNKKSNTKKFSRVCGRADGGELLDRLGAYNRSKIQP